MRAAAGCFSAALSLLLLAAVAVRPAKWVRVKMLPFDNKSEFQVIIDMPDGTPLEQTTRVAQALGQHLAQQPEVINYQIYAGTSGPYNFNGLVRHYFLRAQPNQADIQVNLLSRHDRSAQSHEIAQALAPGTGQDRGTVRRAHQSGRGSARSARAADAGRRSLRPRLQRPDRTRRPDQADLSADARSSGCGLVRRRSADQVRHESGSRQGGAAWDFACRRDRARCRSDWAEPNAGLLHDPQSREDIPIEVRLARADRSGIEDLGKPETADGFRWPDRAAGSHEPSSRPTIDTSVYRKNLQPVVYVTGDVAGGEESPVYAIMKMSDAIDKIKLPDGYGVKQYKGTTMPERTDRFSMKWDGEWHITVEVFRDLGLAFAAVLVLIYVLVVGWFRSFITPLVIMAPIPLTLVGILPAHALMGAFFTATSMIGFIAGAGIIVRNSIILVDFIELRRSQGMSLEEAVVDAGAVRFRPMLLTAAAVVVGASVILFDPIFQGLAFSLMAGEVASTVLSRMAVPVLYYLSQKRKALPRRIRIRRRISRSVKYRSVK